MHSIYTFWATYPSSKNRKKAYVFTEIKVSSSTSLILYMTTYRLYACETLL